MLHRLRPKSVLALQLTEDLAPLVRPQSVGALRRPARLQTPLGEVAVLTKSRTRDSLKADEPPPLQVLLRRCLNYTPQ